MKVRYTYRLRPGSKATAYLLAEWDACRYVWNRMVDESKERYALRRGETFGGKQAQKYLTMLRAFTVNENGNKWLSAHSCVPQQQIVRDFTQARKRAITGKKRLGLPAYKSRKNSLPTLNYRLGGFTLKTINGKQRLVLPKGTVIPVVWSRPLPSSPKSVRVFREPDGHWYASFVVDITGEPAKHTGTTVGIDWGVETTASTVLLDARTGQVSEENTLDLPHIAFEGDEHHKVAQAQRRMSRRRKKGAKYSEQSRGYKKARRQYKELCRRIKARRTDTAHKWAKKVCAHADTICAENFKPRFLAKTNMAHNAQDAAIGAVIRTLKWQAAKHGRTYIDIPTPYTTQRCSNCGAIAKPALTLKDRVYECKHCGMIRDRDKNAACNMLEGVGLNPGAKEAISRKPDAVPATQAPSTLRIPRL
uniref:RNA-guided endonuclease InsQ/TnpB family protein n=1 Tax=Bifidobacterium adolescentis TaxID=1680 RepID=UPI00359C9655